MTKKKNSYAVVILILVCAGIFAPNFGQYQVSGFGPQLMKAMGLSTSQFAQIATAPLIPGIFLSLVAGILVDKFGARRCMVLAMLLSALGVIWRYFAAGYTAMYFSMIAMGIGATFLSSNNAKILGQWFPPHKIAITVGIYLGVSNGAIALGTGTASLFPSMQAAFLFSAGIAVAVFLLYLFFMRDKKTEPVRQTVEQPEERTSILDGIRVSVKNKYVWVAAICLLLNVTAFCSMSQFLPQALAARGIAQSAANTVAMALTLGGLVSCFFSPTIFFMIGRTKLLMVIYSVIAALGMAFAWRLSDSTTVLFLLIFVTGFFANGFNPILLSLPIRLEDIGIKYAGTAGGVIATIQLAGTVIIPSYIISPIAGTNYSLMFLLFAALDVLLCFVVHLLPKMER